MTTYIRGLAPSVTRAVRRRIGPETVFQRTNATPQPRQEPQPDPNTFLPLPSDPRPEAATAGGVDGAIRQALDSLRSTYAPDGGYQTGSGGLNLPDLSNVTNAARDSLEFGSVLSGLNPLLAPVGVLQSAIAGWLPDGTPVDAEGVPIAALANLPGNVLEQLRASLEEAGAFAADGLTPAQRAYAQRLQGEADAILPSDLERTYVTVLDGLMREVAAMIAARDQAIADGDAEIAATYGAQIDQINDQIGAVRRAKSGIEAAYDARNAAVAPAYQAAINTALPTGAEIQALSEAAQTGIGDVFAESNERLSAALATIGATDAALGQQATQILTEFQGTITDGIRESLDNEALLTVKAGEVAKAMATAAYASDQHMSAVEEEKIRLELQGTINDLVKQREEVVEAQARAKEKWRAEVADSFGDITFDLDPYETFERFYENLAGEWGWNFEETSDEFQAFNAVYEAGVRTRAEAEEYWRNLVFNANLEKLTLATGLDPNAVIGVLGDRAVSILSNAGDLNFVSTLTSLFQNSALGGIEWESMTERSAQLDIWDAWQTHVNEFEETMASLRTQLNYLRNTPGAAANLTQGDMATVRAASGRTGYLHPVAAQSYNTMFQAAAADGVQLNFSDTYRSYAHQMQAYQHFLRTGENLAGNRVPNIAHPDNSNHPKGLAIDFTLSTGVLDWLEANGSRFGWRRIASEPWHWEFIG